MRFQECPTAHQMFLSSLFSSFLFFYRCVVFVIVVKKQSLDQHLDE